KKYIKQLSDDLYKNYNKDDILKLSTFYKIPSDKPIRQLCHDIALRNLELSIYNSAYMMKVNMLEQLVEKYIKKPWDWGSDGLSRNPGITPEFIEKHIDEKCDWGSDGLSENHSITPEFVEKHM